MSSAAPPPATTRVPVPRPFYKKKRTWILVSLILICVTVSLFWWRETSSVTAQLNRLREQGFPTTAKEVNAYYAVPDGMTDTTELWVRAIDSVVNTNLTSAGEKLPIVGLSETPIPPPGEAWDQLEACRDLLTKFAEVLKVIHMAAAAGGVARLPSDFTAGINTVITQSQDCRSLTRLLELDAYVSAHDGHHARVLQDISGIFAAAEMLQAEPLVISQLVRMALHAQACQTTEKLLEHCEWSDEDLATLQEAAAAMDFRQAVRTAFCGERGVCLTSLDLFPLGPFRQANARAVLQFIGRALDALQQPWPEAMDEAAKLNSEIFRLASGKVTRFTMVGVTMVVPAMEQTIIAAARAEARRNVLVTAIAVRRYQMRHGEFPASIADLPAELLPSNDGTMTTDSFDNNPLRYVVQEENAVVYSIGDDRKDDGGLSDSGEEPPSDLGITVSR